jgi:tripartite-type tricarboxylate transporter receptor subunit TctC
MFAVGAMISSAPSAFSQHYPNKPLRIVATEPGGSNDFMSRLIAQGISGPLGQAVIVENRAGANVTAEIVAKAAPDGYTLLSIGSSFWIAPLLRKTSYDLLRDFSLITLMTSTPTVLVVHPSFAPKSVKELIAVAKSKPGQLNYSSSVLGGAFHLAGELFNSMAGTKIQVIPYKGTAGAVTAVLGGEVQMTFSTTAAAAPHVKSGKLRALAVTSAKPSALMPDLPTVAASGLPGYEAISVVGTVAPAKTPPPIINRLHAEIVAVLSKPEVKEKLFSSGVEAVGASPEAFALLIKNEVARMGKVIKEAGIRIEE